MGPIYRKTQTGQISPIREEKLNFNGKSFFRRR